MVLVQPAELVIIGGAALGTILVGNPLPLAIKVFKSVLGLFAGSKFTKHFYLETLKMMSEIFTFARKSGTAKLEEEVEESREERNVQEVPESSQGSPHSPLHLRHAANRAIRCRCPARPRYAPRSGYRDSSPRDCSPRHALWYVSDTHCPDSATSPGRPRSLITWGPSRSAAEIGHKVAAALVGKLSRHSRFGRVSVPVAANLEKTNDAETQYYRPCGPAGWLRRRGWRP